MPKTCEWISKVCATLVPRPVSRRRRISSEFAFLFDEDAARPDSGGAAPSGVIISAGRERGPFDLYAGVAYHAQAVKHFEPANESMRVLVVEDDKKIATFITKGLKEAGYAVDCVGNGDDALHFGLNIHYDAAVMDLMLPELDGLSVIERWRAQKVKTPVLILSARRSVDDRVKGLQAGGDDYVTKPFAFTELLARVQALIRRSSHTSEPTTLSYADLTLNLLTRDVHRGEKKIELQAREFSLLEYLLRNSNRVVSKTMILEHVWDYAFDPSTNVVDVLVCRLRNKVDREFEPKLIHTLRGAGYVLKRD